MKKIALLITTLATTGAFAQAVNTSATSTTSSSSANILKNFGLTLETEIATERAKKDDNYEVQGYSSFYEIEPSYKFSKDVNVSLGAQYTVSEMEGGDKRRNRNNLGTTFIKANYKALNRKEGAAIDLKLQARAYADQDTFLNEFYGSDGNYQLRAYFGAPIASGIYLNKYNTYLRYKKYTANDDSSQFSRDFEYRARVNPTYRLKIGTEVGVTATYNHIFKRGAGFGSDEESVDIDLSARHQFGKIAYMLRAGTTALDNDETGDLKATVDAMDKINYAFNIEAYVF